MSHHLSTQGRPDPTGGSIVSGVQTKLEPFLLAHLCIKTRQKQIRIEKVTAPKIERVKNLKIQTTEHYNA
jgi:hypothetical protein